MEGGGSFPSLFFLKITDMYKVKEKFAGAFVTCDKFAVTLNDASQTQLEHLFHLGHIGVEFTGKKPKNKPVDNLENTIEDKLTNE